jgi:hypothetical protein
MAELESTENCVNSFNYTFFRYTHGPMTTEIYEDAHRLHNAGLITFPEKGPIKATDKGKQLMASISDLYRENEHVCKYVEESAKKYAHLTFGALKHKIYNRVIDLDGMKIKIGDIPLYVEVLSNIEGENIPKFRIDDDWVDTLWGEFNYTEDEKALGAKIHPVTVCV